MTKPFLLISAVVIVISGVLSCTDSEGDTAAKNSEKSSTTEDYSPYHDIPHASYIGGKSCKECHEKEYADWMLSDHHKAMMPPTEENMLGDFDDAIFDHQGVKTRLFRKGDEYWVNTEGPDGEMVDYKIDYAFGHYPLQQYLVEFPGGRYQALQVCWDSRPKEEGGQRWYHLYEDEPIPHDDVLHWTRRHFNWNYMCADCHSTDLRKNFDPKTDEYNTTWSEMNVSCEACHGPSSEHVKWAHTKTAEESGASIDDSQKLDTTEMSGYLKSKGLVVTLKEPEQGGWLLNPETKQPERTIPLKSTVQVETCARCHSHRQLNEPNYIAGQGFHDTHSPSVLSDQLYHHDGQVDEEVYVYGSFVQSKMYHKGVRCTDCHNPHSMKLKAPGNALCIQCHDGTTYDAPTHHFHPVGSTGASCVECHMPTKTYMGVDARRDHSLRIPRPDLSKKTGSPNACNQCHDDKDVDWAAEAFTNWWGKGPRNKHYGELLAEGRSGAPGGLDKLMALANDKDRPGIVRATALQSMANYHAPTQQSIQVIVAQLADKDPAVRKQAVSALLPLAPTQRLQTAAHMLTDKSRAVRTEAARVLAAAVGAMDETQRANFDKAAAEFINQQNAIADRAAGHMGLALFYADQGDQVKAEAAYRDGIRIEPEFIPVRVNLAELLLAQNRVLDAETEFRGAVENAMVDENEGMARDAFSRFLVRQKRYDEALAELAKATELLPRHAQTHYFYGVALNSLGKFEDSIKPLIRAIELDPSNVEYLVGVSAIFRDAGRIDAALKYASEAARLQPQNPQVQGMLRDLENRMRGGVPTNN